jgi:hypothetical protein
VLDLVAKVLPIEIDTRTVFKELIVRIWEPLFAIREADVQIYFEVLGEEERDANQLPGVGVQSVTASPDGATLYFAVAGSVWAISSGGGEPRRICDDYV